MTEINPFESCVTKKPIDEVLKLMKQLTEDISEIKNEINHIKLYIRKHEVREGIKEDLAKEYVKPDKGWFW
tara:strand:+ start:532 stop:744 length:213 start_codon:yes stop_codon:yes gene_type:complete